MALPRINETLNFTLTIPSTGQIVKYRPYLVKEEKVLLQAFESRDQKTCLEAMCDTLNACLDQESKVDVSRLATFDVEYMFTQMRAKSVGETSTIFIRCKTPDCKQSNEYVINLEDLSVHVDRQNNIIPITDSIKVEMRYPSYDSLVSGEVDAAQTDLNTALSLIAGSIAAVITDDERISSDSVSKEELQEFLTSMTANQLKLLTDFLEEMPALKHNAEFKCIKCGTDNELELKGLSDFF